MRHRVQFKTLELLLWSAIWKYIKGIFRFFYQSHRLEMWFILIMIWENSKALLFMINVICCQLAIIFIIHKMYLITMNKLVFPLSSDSRWINENEKTKWIIRLFVGVILKIVTLCFYSKVSWMSSGNNIWKFLVTLKMI